MIMKYEKTIKIGPCDKRGKSDAFCNGEYNGPRCPAKYAFFGLVNSQGGWKEQEGNIDGSCPEYVKWAIPWEGKTEYVEIVNGGQGPGFHSDNGHCMYMKIIATNPKVLKTMEELFELVPKGNNAITSYLKENLGAPSNIREIAFQTASHHNEPRIKTVKK